MHPFTFNNLRRAILLPPPFIVTTKLEQLQSLECLIKLASVPQQSLDLLLQAIDIHNKESELL